MLNLEVNSIPPSEMPEIWHCRTDHRKYRTEYFKVYFPCFKKLFILLDKYLFLSRPHKVGFCLFCSVFSSISFPTQVTAMCDEPRFPGNGPMPVSEQEAVNKFCILLHLLNCLLYQPTSFLTSASAIHSPIPLVTKFSYPCKTDFIF